jgi:hypothetical protein
VVHLYSLCVRIEQSERQVKQTLGGAEYHVRADRAIRRHWHLVSCALTLCWWAEAQGASAVWELQETTAHPVQEEHREEDHAGVASPGVVRKKRCRRQKKGLR